MDIFECPIGILNGFQKETEKYVDEKTVFYTEKKTRNVQEERSKRALVSVISP